MKLKHFTAVLFGIISVMIMSVCASAEDVTISFNNSGVPTTSVGTGWTFNLTNRTLTLDAGNNYTVGDVDSAYQVQCNVINNGTISGGIFKSGSTVTNQSGGTITDGTFYGIVTNQSGGKILGGLFYGQVTNQSDGTISGGIFYSDSTVNNSGTIEDGAFSGEVTNKTGGTKTDSHIEVFTKYG